MELLPPPTPAQLLTSLAWFIGTGIAFVLISSGANQAARRSTGIRAQVSRFMAYATLIIGLGWLAIVGLAMVYPHHHGGAEWLEGAREMNHVIDMAIGLAVWVIAWVVYRLSWRKPAD